MSCVRPRSFSSSILLALSSMIHKKFAAKGLIECLYNIGICASYSETVRFETSIVSDPENLTLLPDSYLQFVFDNADHNTATIDGKNTFHCMGGIMCVTPASSVKTDSEVTRLKGTLPEITSGKFGYLPLVEFSQTEPFSLKKLIVQDLDKLNPITSTFCIKPLDLIWHYGKHTAPQITMGWHGFMNKYHDLNTDFSMTKVIPLPFVNASPSDYMTILTVLVEARRRADANGQKHCFCTFDQPLCLKAWEILASIDPNNDPHNLSSVIVRLGGFHLLMSYLGTVGMIMQGSGLKEAFCQIFAELSADKALAGHAFSRAVRGHLLVQTSLASIIFQTEELTDDEKSFLNASLANLGKDKKIVKNPILKKIEEKFVDGIQNLRRKGPTSQLWLQYFEIISLMQRFIDAEHSGNFKEHLEVVQLMIPIFYASGHHNYAKCAHLYLQKMFELENIMDIVEYDKFCRQGFFTMRRSNRFWTGVWSDMTIEQVLMRAMKCSGGLTHGRGLTEAIIAKWILSMIAIMEVVNQMENFCDVSFSTSEQHVDNRTSRIAVSYTHLDVYKRQDK